MFHKNKFETMNTAWKRPAGTPLLDGKPVLDSDGNPYTGETLRNEMSTTPPNSDLRLFLDENGKHYTGDTLKKVITDTHMALMNPKIKEYISVLNPVFPVIPVTKKRTPKFVLNSDSSFASSDSTSEKKAISPTNRTKIKDNMRLLNPVTPVTMRSDSDSSLSSFGSSTDEDATSPTHRIVGEGSKIGERYSWVTCPEKKRKFQEESRWWEMFEPHLVKFFQNVRRFVEEIDFKLGWMADVATKELLEDTQTFLRLLKELNQKWTYNADYDFFDEYQPEEMNINFFVQVLMEEDMMRGIEDEMILKIAHFLMSVGAIQSETTRCVSWALKPIVELDESGDEIVLYDFIPTFYFKPLARDTRAFFGEEVAGYVGRHKMANAVVCGYLEKYEAAFDKCVKDGIKSLPDDARDDARELNLTAVYKKADLMEALVKFRNADVDVSWLTIYGKMKRFWPMNYNMAVLVEDLIWNEGNFQPIEFKKIPGKDCILYWLDGGTFENDGISANA